MREFRRRRLQWLQRPRRHFSFERGRESGGRLIFVSCQNPECAPRPWKDLAWHGVPWHTESATAWRHGGGFNEWDSTFEGVVVGTAKNSIRVLLCRPFSISPLFLIGERRLTYYLLCQVEEKSSLGGPLCLLREKALRPFAPPPSLPPPRPRTRTQSGSHSLIRVTDSSSIFNAAQK